MRFADYRNETVHAQRQLDKLAEAAHRQWVTPDGRLLIETRISVHAPLVDDKPEDAAVTYGVSCVLWRMKSEMTVEVNGKRYSGGYFEHEYNALHKLTADQLAFVRRAREHLERWVDGEIESLALDLFRDG
jgi:hypothetical protein